MRYQYPCKSCGQFKHNLFDCPQISLQIDRSAYLKRYTTQFDQERNQKYHRKPNKFRSLALLYSVKKKAKKLRYDVIRNIFDGFDELQDNSQFFESHDDKEFFLLLPKINSQKLVNNYKNIHEEEDYVLEDIPTKQAHSEGFINLKQMPFADDILEFTDSLNSSSLTSSDDSSQLSYSQKRLSRKSIKSNFSSTSQRDKLIMAESNIQNISFNEFEEDGKSGLSNNMNAELKVNNNMSIKQQPYINPNLYAQQFHSSQLIQYEKNTTLQIEQDGKKDMNSSHSSMHNKDLSVLTFDPGNSQKNNNLTANTIMNKNIAQLLKDEKKLGKSNTSELHPQNRRKAQKHLSLVHNQQSMNPNIQNKQINNPTSNTNILDGEDAVLCSYDKIKTIRETEPFKRKQTRQNTLEVLSNIGQNMSSNVSTQQQQQQQVFIDQMKMLLDMLEQNKNTAMNRQIKEQKEKLKQQQSIAPKMKKSNHSQNTQNKYQGIMNYKHYQSQKSSQISNSRLLNQLNPYSNLNDDIFQLAGVNVNNNNSSNNECLFGKCGFRFDVIREFEYYYPKFNYTYVIKAYKKQKQFHQKQGKSLFFKHSATQKQNENLLYKQLKQSLGLYQISKNQQQSLTSFS